MDISAVVLTKNESSVLGRCLKKLQFCSEILVIDDYSTDTTRLVARTFGATVYKRHLGNNFAAQRNFALTKAKNAWVLFVDADEIVNTNLRKEIQYAVTSDTIVGYYIPRKDVFLGKQLNHGEFGKTQLLRLGKRQEGKWVRPVHEKWEIMGPTLSLKEPLFHYSHDSLSQFITQTSFHAELHAKQRHHEVGDISLLRVLLYPAGKFLFNFLYLRGFQDGTRGFVAAVMMSFHSFLAWSTVILHYDKKH